MEKQNNKTMKFITITSLLLTLFFTFSAYGQGKISTVNLSRGVSMKFVLIPSGTFEMGYVQAKKVRKVTISRSFEMGQTEVTQAQWKAVAGDNPSLFKGDNLPVENINWEDVQEFIKKLNAKGIGKFRLPTEAEWEYACRAGTSTKYSFGDDEKLLGNYAWFGTNSGDKTHEVATKKPNPWGLYDMHGNVGEWVSDWDAPYTGEVLTDPQGPASGKDKVHRGGNYAFSADGLLCQYRDNYALTYTNQQVGFRLVREIAATKTKRTK